MISSIFGKTKPINYLLLLGFLFVFYWPVHLVSFNRRYSPEEFIIQLLLVGVLFFSVFLVNFIVKRNQITGGNAFAMLYFILLIVVFPEVLVDGNAIMSNFFLLLACRRLISLRTLKDIKLKIFDATLWIGISSLFYDWALLFIILVFVSIYFYEPKNLKNWLVPISSMAAALLVAASLLILMGLPDFLQEHYTFSLSTTHNFSGLGTYSIKLVIYSAIIILTGFAAFLKMGTLGLGRIITVRLVAIALTIGLVVTFLKTDNTTYPVLLTFFPAATLITKYVEVIKRYNIREIVLMASVLAPFILLLIRAF